MFRTVILATTLTASAAVAPAALATPTPSPGAGTTQALERLQQAGSSAIARRQTTITTATNAVTRHDSITDADRAPLIDALTRTSDGLDAVGHELAADTTTEDARTDYRAIFTDYRVYALVVPQVHLAAAADAITGTVVPKLEDAQQKLEGALAAEPDKNTADVKAAMSDLTTRLSDIGEATSGLSASVLAVTPEQFNANHAVLAEPRARLRTARADVASALRDIRTAAKALR